MHYLLDVYNLHWGINSVYGQYESWHVVGLQAISNKWIATVRGSSTWWHDNSLIWPSKGWTQKFSK